MNYDACKCVCSYAWDAFLLKSDIFHNNDVKIINLIAAVCDTLCRSVSVQLVGSTQYCNQRQVNAVVTI